MVFYWQVCTCEQFAFGFSTTLPVSFRAAVLPPRAVCFFTFLNFFHVVPSVVEGLPIFFRVILSGALAKSKNPINRNVQLYKANTYNIIRNAYALSDETHSTPLRFAQGDSGADPHLSVAFGFSILFVNVKIIIFFHIMLGFLCVTYSKSA